MDDSGIADAFYTVLSIGIVLVAALAVSGVILSTTMEQGTDADAMISSFGDGGMKKGLYCFYYSVNASEGNYYSGDPDDIVLTRLTAEGSDEHLILNASNAPPSAPEHMGMAIWSGYLYIPLDGPYAFKLESEGGAWLWVDGSIVAENPLQTTQANDFTLNLTRGYHPLKAKYFYQELSHASCTLSWLQGGNIVPVGSLYR